MLFVHRFLIPGSLLLIVLLGVGTSGRAQEVPAWLPRYDLDIRIDPHQHQVVVHQRVHWLNRHARPTAELVFNVFPAHKIADGDIAYQAKLLEIERLSPSEALDYEGHALQVERITLADASGAEVALPFHYQAENDTALVVPLPRAVAQGESVVVDLEFTLRLPQKQGRWGQWQGVVSLVNWYPVLAYHDDNGWQSVPFVPWHPAVYQEAGLYTARVTLPSDQRVACTGSPAARTELEGGWQQLDFVPRVARDYALVASAHYQEFETQAAGVRLRCLAFPEHAHHAEVMLQVAGEALAAYGRWFGDYPYPEFTIVEAFAGWKGQVAAGMILMDERLFALPHLAEGLVEVMVAQQTCRQWWYNVIGTNGYVETWMDEGLAEYFAHRLLDQKLGKNNSLLHWPKQLDWLFQIRREDFRHADLCGTLARGEAGPTIQEIPHFEHSVNLGSLARDRGGKIVGMIEARMGERAFLDFMRLLYAGHAFRVLRVADFQRELESYTGQSWEEFCRNWLYGPGTTDWCIDKVHIAPARRQPGDLALGRWWPGRRGGGSFQVVTVLVVQKAEVNEPTELGICLGEDGAYAIRIPIDPRQDLVTLAEPPATVQKLADNQFRVEVLLPERPVQMAVDPEERLVDREPANNFWHPPVRWRVTPLYTGLEETDLTCAYDRWNVILGPWLTDSAYNDPWFSFSDVLGFRLGAYRTQQFSGGIYTGFRPMFRDLAVGVDGLWDHWPWPHTQVGFNAEKSLEGYPSRRGHADRAIGYGRYVFDESDSLYQPPMHFLELFGSTTSNLLPVARTFVPGAERFSVQNPVGVQYHLNFLAPYWDAERGFQVDATAATGVPIFGQPEAFHEVSAQVSGVQAPPEGLGWLSETRLAARLYGAAGVPSRAELFTMGGSQLFRGFDMAERQGSLVWVGSLEWRLPLVKHASWDCCDHSISLRNAYVVPFYDVGDAYVRSHAAGPIAQAVGAGVRFDVAWFSFFEHTILRFDTAKAVNGNTPVQFWIGVEHPF